MIRYLGTFLTLTTLFAATSLGLPVDLPKLLDWADNHAIIDTFTDDFGKYIPDFGKGECGHFPMRAIAEAAPELVSRMVLWRRFNPLCDVIDATYNDGLPILHLAIPFLQRSGWQCDVYYVKRSDPLLPQTVVLPGDIVGFEPWGNQGQSPYFSSRARARPGRLGYERYCCSGSVLRGRPGRR